MKQLAVISILLLPLMLFSQKASVTVDSSTYLVGDYIRVEASAERSGLLVFPSPDALAGSLELVSAAPADTSADSSRIIQNLIFSAYDSGDYYIPSVQFIYKNNSTFDTVVTDSLPVRVNLVAVDTTQAFKPIKENIDVDYTDYSWLWWVLVVMILAAFAWLAYRYWRKRAEQLANKPRVITSTLSSYSLGQLDELEVEKVWQDGRYKEYFSRLTDVLRHYMEQRLGIRAMEATTDEILDAIGHDGGIEELLRLSDNVKFAKYLPVEAQCVKAMETTRSYIHSTTPDPDPEIELKVR